MTILSYDAYSPGRLPDSMVESFAALLLAVDNEFVPALSTRYGVGTTNFTEPQSNNLDTYLHDLLTQHNIVATREGTVVGFLSYSAEIVVGSSVISPCYVSTVAVATAIRGEGVSRRLYQELFERVKTDISVRTWTSNVAHIKVLNSSGFSLSATIHDDRGVGESTLYFTYESRRT